MLRLISTLIAGIALGIMLTLATVEVAGGWYTYAVVPLKECQDAAGYGLGVLRDEVVPDQPNPCHFRRLRWHFLY